MRYNERYNEYQHHVLEIRNFDTPRSEFTSCADWKLVTERVAKPRLRPIVVRIPEKTKHWQYCTAVPGPTIPDHDRKGTKQKANPRQPERKLLENEVVQDCSRLFKSKCKCKTGQNEAKIDQSKLQCSRGSGLDKPPVLLQKWGRSMPG